MSIRIKLILTYAILVIISTVILIFSGIAIFTNMISETADAVLEEDDIQVIIRETINILAELKQAEDDNNLSLISPDHIKEVSESLTFIDGGIVVKYQDDVYSFNALPSDPAFQALLVESNHIRGHDNDSDKSPPLISYKEDKYFYVDYSFNVGSEKVVYYFVVDVTKTNDIGAAAGERFLWTIFVILLIITTPIIWIVTRDIIKPIKKLEYGVQHIKDGDLDFKLETKRNNEIGKVVRYFDVMRFELKKSIEKQVKFEENRKELISSISHDLKTPITSIKGHVEGIRDGIANTPEKLDKYLSVIYQKSRDMDQLIDDLFLFSKLDLNRLPFDMKKQKVKPFITEVVNESQLGWADEQHQISLNLNISDDASVDIDIMQIKRVFINIIQNAMKYMDKELKEIEIFVTEEENSVQFVISDNGQGIDKEHLNHIFDRFYRVDESRNPETGGTGLGLAISKQIIDQHSGHILATSQPGQGTKIIVELLKTQKRGLNEENPNHRR